MTRLRPRGTTLMEIMITLVVVLIGMLGLFKVLSTSSQAGAQAQHIMQARARAQAVSEAIRNAPKSVVDCLASTAVAGWAGCEALCRNSSPYNIPAPPAACSQVSPLPAAAPMQSPACIFSSICYLRQSDDSTSQQYALVVDPNQLYRTTSVTRAGLSGHLYEVLITIGWNDDGTATQNATATLPNHRVSIHSAVFK